MIGCIRTNTKIPIILCKKPTHLHVSIAYIQIYTVHWHTRGWEQFQSLRLTLEPVLSCLWKYQSPILTVRPYFKQFHPQMYTTIAKTSLKPTPNNPPPKKKCWKPWNGFVEFFIMKINQYLQLSISSVTDVMSRDGVASKRVKTCSSRLKLTLMNTLFIRNTTPYISENRVFWLKYGF